MMDRLITRKTRKTSYPSNLLTSLRNLSRRWTEERYEERLRASHSPGFSRIVGRLFPFTTPRKHSFARLTRFSRRLERLVHIKVMMGALKHA